MTNDTLSQKVENPLPLLEACPFLDQGRLYCQATTSSKIPDGGKLSSLCATEDHDRCPFFLAKVLRDAQTQRTRMLAVNAAWLC